MYILVVLDSKVKLIAVSSVEISELSTGEYGLMAEDFNRHVLFIGIGDKPEDAGAYIEDIYEYGKVDLTKYNCECYKMTDKKFPGRLI